jgi:hypothetical protein
MHMRRAGHVVTRPLNLGVDMTSAVKQKMSSIEGVRYFMGMI